MPSSIESVTRSSEELLHELQVHQIELEMQNEELRRIHVSLEESRDRYIDLYDYAPVGYLLLTHEGLISDINLTATKLLKVDRKKLLSRRFVTLVTPNDSDRWYLFFTDIIKHNKRLNIELILKACDDTEIPVQLDCLWVNSMLRITLTDITKIKQAEAALREAETLVLISAERMQTEKVREEALNRLQNIAGQLPGVVFQFRLRADGSSSFPYVSAAIRDIYRLSPEEVREDASKVFSILHPDDYDSVVASIQESAQDLSPWNQEYRVRFDDGTVRWLLGNAQLQRDMDGSTLGYGFITDITERKQAEEVLRKYRYQLDSFIKQAPLSIAMFDLNMNYLAISDRWRMEFDQGSKDLIGCNYYEVCPDLPAEWKVIHQQCLAGASLKNDDDLWLQKDGSKYWLRWAVSPWFDGKGSIGGIIITIENITERKQMGETLQVVEKRLDLAVECSDIGVWDLDLIHDTSWRSLGHDRIFGYEVPPTEWNTAIAMRHVVPEDREIFSRCFNKAFRTGKLFLECRIIQPDQSLRWINARGRVLYDENAQPMRMLGTVVDITEHKNAKKKEKEHLEKLAQVTRLGLMGEMASGIAHEVNQPLSAIATYTQVSINLINTGNPDLVNLNEVLFKTQQQALRAGRIIHRMKEFGQFHSQERLTTDINTLIYDATEFCVIELKHNNIVQNFDLTDKLPPVFVDHIQIEQVIINLIRNSVDTLQNLPANHRRQLTIRSHLTANNDIQVTVKDNGLGIDDDQKQEILTPFFTTKLNGTGMGLSISRSLIQAHEGTLYFNSELGKGSTFYFTLPIKAAEKEDAER